MEELARTSTAQVTQAKHLFDHVRLAERRIGEVDGEKQQYAAENDWLRERVLSLEKRIRNTEGLVESLRREAKMQRAKFTSKGQDLNAAVFRAHELEKETLVAGWRESFS